MVTIGAAIGGAADGHLLAHPEAKCAPMLTHFIGANQKLTAQVSSTATMPFPAGPPTVVEPRTACCDARMVAGFAPGLAVLRSFTVEIICSSSRCIQLTLPVSGRYFRKFSISGPVTSAGSAGRNSEKYQMVKAKSTSAADAIGEANSLMWFRKGLRLHDNPALQSACENSAHVCCVFVLDPWFLAPDPSAPSPGSARVGLNRIRFLLESLSDLDVSTHCTPVSKSHDWNAFETRLCSFLS